MLVEPTDPRSQTTIDLSKDCFRKATSTFPFVVVPIEISYEGTFLPGYFYHATKKELANDNEKQLRKNNDTNSQDENNGKKGNYERSVTDTSVNPTLVVHGGFDSTLEELYSFAAAPALERGYNCLTFEGPGQGNVIRKQKIPFRHDWEKVVTPALEFMLSKMEFHVDPKHIGLMGISMGDIWQPGLLLLSRAFQLLCFMTAYMTAMMLSHQAFRHQCKRRLKKAIQDS